MNRELMDIARHECQTFARLMAIRVIAQDRRIADAAVAEERRKGERRYSVRYNDSPTRSW